MDNSLGFDPNSPRKRRPSSTRASDENDSGQKSENLQDGSLDSKSHKRDEVQEHKARIVNEVFGSTLKSKAQVLQSKYLQQMDEELTKLIDTFIQEAAPSTKSLTHSDSFSTPLQKPGDRKNNQLMRKEFHSRTSALTDLFEIPHIQTIQYIFIAVLIFFLANTLISDIFDHGTIGVDLRIWTFAFGKMPHVIAFWIGMQTSTLAVVYGALCYWAQNRTKSPRIETFDRLCLSAYVGYLLAFVVIPLYFVNHWNLPPASAAIIVAEQTRFIMKAHAFVREKIPEILANSAETESKLTLSFSNYLYFQFAPTLVYRDNYPRNKEIRWNLVLMHFTHFLCGVAYCNYIFLRFCIPIFKNFNLERVNFETFVKTIMNCILPGTLNMFVVFYAFLHSWMNGWAELLRFADRMFYRDWWNSTTFSNYYRTWNIVVHDWLYSYVYCDLSKLCGPRHRAAAMIITFLLSALVHEYIFCCFLRIFYPVLFVLFAGFGVWMVYVTQSRSSKSWNVIMWLSIFLGQGVLLCLYSSEYYARMNCPPTTDDMWDYVIPRSWSCYVLYPTLNPTSTAI